MKIPLSIAFLILLTFGAALAQRTEPSQKVDVELRSGDKITGLFVSADSETVSIKVSSNDLKFKLNEIRALRFGSEDAVAKPTTQAATPGGVLAELPPPASLKDVDIEKVALFPADYPNNLLMFQRVFISDLRAIPIDGKTYYSIDVKSLKGKIFLSGISANNEINFLMEDSLAREIQAFYQKNVKLQDTGFGANLIVRTALYTENQQRLFIAAISCVQIIDFRSRVLETLGLCQR